MGVLFALQIALVDDTNTPEEETYFVHNDHLGTPQKITDDTQTVVWAGSYEPFGEVEETVATIENNIRFPGQYEDGENGLHYNYFRDYDPSLGRYVESDPVGLLGGINTYSYSGLNPILFIDPDGLRRVVGYFCETKCRIDSRNKCDDCPDGTIISGLGQSPSSPTAALAESIRMFNLSFEGGGFSNCECRGPRTFCGFVYEDEFSDKFRDFMEERMRDFQRFMRIPPTLGPELSDKFLSGLRG